MQLKVIKTDGSVEEYLHTKIIGTISTALSAIGRADIYVAEELAEVVTFYLYKRQHRRTANISEIFSIIKAVLASTGHEEAAAALSEHNFERRLKRSRVEVVSVDVEKLADAEMLCQNDHPDRRSRWDKTRIVKDLMEKYDVSRQTARTIASMVEEKIFNMGLTLVSASLIKQLVLSDTAAVLRAHNQLQLQT
jgi:transcriptional regulator NrdR family protein